MNLRMRLLLAAALSAEFVLVPSLQAQPLVNIETVTVGDAGNAADTTGYGAVNYEFNIGKYEVTIEQYATFLNSVASVTDNAFLLNLYSSSMASAPIAGISRSGSGTSFDPYSYSVIGTGSRPIAYVSWFRAARFANWIHNGATLGASTESGAYELNGATNGIFLKNPNATWWIPSEDEWYKAAYYKAGGTDAGYWLYPTQSDVAPSNNIGSEPNQANIYAGVYAVPRTETYVHGPNYLTEVGAFSGSVGAYGTFDQAGSLAEWNDAASESVRFFRGSSWSQDEQLAQSSTRWAGFFPDYENNFIGFRLATVPEPSTYALLLMTGAGALWLARRRR